VDGVLLLGLIVVGLIALDVAAIRFGVDSRDGFNDPRAQVRPTGIFF
jgi:hypothetical protein